jgi:NAD(P)-dependent dehydrogenase (short-subunit alcohol dehydrogenase family)
MEAAVGVLVDKVAIVTGSGRGIGRQIAMYFAAEGARVVVNDLGGNPDGTGSGRIADDVVEEIRGAGGEAVANHDSVATMEGGAAIFQTALNAFGQCDILVNNAGILRDRTIVNMTEAEWDAVVAVHLKGHFCCSQPFTRYIRETARLGCRIVNFSSTSGLYGNFGQTNYGAAKAGIAGFTRVLALEMMKYQCTVNTIAPAAATRLTIELMQAAGQEADPHDPMQGPQQLGPVITWLASEEAASITNQIFYVSGSHLGIMQQPKVINQFVTDHLWTLDELDVAMPKLVEAKHKHDEAVDRRAIARTL